MGPYPEDPYADTLEVQAAVYGGCSTVVDIEINDPYYYYLYAGAQANYAVTGETSISLDGDIGY